MDGDTHTSGRLAERGCLIHYGETDTARSSLREAPSSNKIGVKTHLL